MTDLGSLRSLAIEMAILSGGETIMIPTHLTLRQLEVTIKSAGAWTGTVVLYDPDGDAIEQTMIAAGADRGFQARWGWNTLKGAPLIDGRILKPESVFMPQGTTLTMEFAAGVAVDALLDRKVCSFKEGMKISDIVRKIASDRGWTVKDRKGRDTIEPTRTVIEKPHNTNGESDLKFVKEQLRANAENESGKGGYRLFVTTDNVLHFHTPAFLPTEEAKIVEYKFARTQFGRVIRFAPSDASVFASIMGAETSLFRGSDSKQAGTVEVKGSASQVTAQGAPAHTDLGDGVKASSYFSGRTAGEVKRKVQDRRDTFREFLYPATMQVIGTHDHEVFDYVDVEYTKVDGKPHFLSGRFQIFGIKHTIDTTGWKTDLELTRPGTKQKPGTKAHVGGNG